MNKQPTEIKSKIKTEFIVLLEVITIKDENIAGLKKIKKDRMNYHLSIWFI